jgi:hypothetical protein
MSSTVAGSGPDSSQEKPACIISVEIWINIGAYLAQKTTLWVINRQMVAKNSTNTDISEKRKKFRELAENRTNRAIESIARIGNLSNRSSYEFDEADVKKIIRALRDSVSGVEARFAAPRGKRSGLFKF